MKYVKPMNYAFFTTRRVAPLAAAAGLLVAFGATPAHALVASGTPFNGFFNTTVSRTGSYATGSGTSTNSPLGIVTESYSFHDYGNITPEHNENIGGTIQFSDGSSILYAVLGSDYPVPVMNYYNFGAYVPFSFSPTLSTGKFAGATGEGQLIASVWNSATGTNTHQLSNTVIMSLPAVPETSSVVSLGILLTLGVSGVLAARKKAARAA